MSSSSSQGSVDSVSPAGVSCSSSTYEPFRVHVDAGLGLKEFRLPHLKPLHHLPGSRFSFESFNFLYRPRILEKFMEILQEKKDYKPLGLRVGGARGCGKSYSLYQLALYLHSQPDRYAVTYIPDCTRWLVDKRCFFEEVLNTFPSFRPLIRVRTDYFHDSDWYSLLQDRIVPYLKEKNMKWIMIFDQVEEIFSHFNLSSVAYRLSHLPFPYHLMGTSVYYCVYPIIAMKASNEPYYEIDKERFSPFDHPTSFSDIEFQSFSSLKASAPVDFNWPLAQDLTGNVPLEFHLLQRQNQWNLNKFKWSRACYYHGIHSDFLRREKPSVSARMLEESAKAVYWALRPWLQL